MRRSMARDARDAICPQFPHECLVAFHALPFLGPLVTRQAIGVGVASHVLDGVRVGVGHIMQPVPEAVPFARQSSGRAIGDVTGVALVFRDPVVSVVPGGQRGAARAGHVIHERMHDVAGSTGLHRLGAFHHRCRRAPGCGEGQEEHADQEQPVVGAMWEALPVHVLHKDEQQDAGHRGGDADAADDVLA